MKHRLKKKRFSHNNCPECQRSDTWGAWSYKKRPYRIVGVFCYRCLKFFWLEKGKLHSEKEKTDDSN